MLIYKRKFINRIFANLIVLFLLFNSFAIVYASYTPYYLSDALRLNRLGLFNGTGTGFQLEKSISRLEGAAMFIRLVGEEDEAFNSKSPIPFTDITQSWAIPYISRMYSQGYSIGISDSLYGTGPMSADQFATYVLRALGYSEDEGDFVWSDALNSLKNFGIISSNDYNIISKGTFYRDYAVKLANAALDAKYKDSKETLFQILESNNNLNNFNDVKPDPIAKGTELTSYQDMIWIFQSMKANMQYSATLNTVGLTLEDIKNWLNLITNTASSDVWGWNIISTYYQDKNYPISVEISWVYNDSYEVAYSYLYQTENLSLSFENQKIKTVVDNFIKDHIRKDMTDYEKIKEVHDFLVVNTKYDTSLVENPNATYDNISDSYTAYGALVNKVAVCDGYAKSFNMFMDILGIQSDRVIGLSIYNNKSVNHAWNRVYLDGEYKFIDVTWDDPVPDLGSRVQYDFFLVSEDFISKDHKWEDSQFDVNYI